MARFPFLDPSGRARFKKRLHLLFLFSIIACLLFLARLIQLNIVKGDYFAKLSEDNFLYPQRINPIRGSIRDRHGEALARSTLGFNLYFSHLRLAKSHINRTLRYLSQLFGHDFSAYRAQLLSRRPRWNKLLLRAGLNLAQVTCLWEHQHDLPGISIEESYQRSYPHGQVFGHITGHMGRIPQGKVEQYLSLGYELDDYVGLAGLETVYEKFLKGKLGQEIILRNARGRNLKSWVDFPSLPGHDIVTTLDAGLQKYIYDALKETQGVAIVMRPTNGEILAMVSSPGFDPNNPGAKGEDVSYFNRAISGHYHPGSTFKPIAALAYLEKGLSPSETFFCDGEFYLPQWRYPFKCNLPKGHGQVNLENGLKFSCNIYFYKGSIKTGGEAMLEMASRLGLGQPTGVDLPGEITGFLPFNSPESLSRGRLLQFSIGQGLIITTPLQMLSSFCAIANGSIAYQPHLLQRIVSATGELIYEFRPKGKQVNLPVEHRRAVIDGLIKVVNEKGGTASAAGFKKEWQVAGKTGTARNPQGQLDAWFVGFAPYDNPEIALLVMIENGGHGGAVAAPIAAQIFDYIFSHPLVNYPARI